MKELGKDERLLCEIQGRIFERSAVGYGSSSAVFVRRYMNSEYAARMDRTGFADRPTDEQEAFASLDEEYGISKYGSRVFHAVELYWMGYIYRYWACASGLSSKAVYKRCSVKDLHAVYYAYHTMDPSNAIERIMEANGFAVGEKKQIADGVMILRRIRNERTAS